MKRKGECESVRNRVGIEVVRADSAGRSWKIKSDWWVQREGKIKDFCGLGYR